MNFQIKCNALFDIRCNDKNRRESQQRVGGGGLMKLSMMLNFTRIG